MDAKCPASELLIQFSDGSLSGMEFAKLAEHFENCIACEMRLAELESQPDPLQSELRSVLHSFPLAADASVPDELVTIAKSMVGAESDLPFKDGSTQLSLDPGYRLASKLAKGHCKLGRFEIESELGVGSFGHVFKAFDPQLQRTVALKVQRAGIFASNEEVERFLHEARAVAQLQHPHIISVHDTVRTDEEICYIVSEFVEGMTLEDVILQSDARLEIGNSQQVSTMIGEIARALQYAHEKGVIHRDVKPSNILIDGDGRPHIMDFGLAKRDLAETMTSDGRVLGTPAYMSPEQAQGQSHLVDRRSDIFSLGVILYELLTGERPFQGNRRMLLLQVLEDEPKRPRQLNSKIPKDLETICLKSLSKSPGKRYQTALEMANDLERFEQGEPVRARRMGYAERLWRWCSRYPLATSLLVGVPIGSLVGLYYLFWLSTFFVEQTALESTRMEADMLEKINEHYSEQVVGRLDWKKIEVTHQYLHSEHSLPLPFTFMIDAGKKISEENDGMQVRIYSLYPWRQDGGPKDDFEKRAIRKLTRSAAADSGNRSYHEFGRANGEPVLRYARAQIMKDSCVKCHNENTHSPKKDWNAGELGGVLSITRTLERESETTSSGLRGAFQLVVGLAVLLIGVCLVFLGTSNRKSRLHN